jgi:hypothetical protein
MSTLETHGDREVRIQAAKAFAITPDDDNDLDCPKSGCALYCNADMTVAVVLVDDDDNTGHIFKFSKGWQPVLAKRVLLTGTSLGGESLFGVY